jgi:glycosyltransferase involved in cell wall biosynthesis
MESPAISVIMPARNAEQYIGAAIESLTRQSFGAFEVVVVEGGSTDRTADVVEDFATRDQRIRLDLQPALGIVAGRNRGASLARGRYLAWLDADDVATPRRLERQIAFMESHPTVAALGGSIVVTDELLRPLLPVSYPSEHKQITATLLEGNSLAASATMIRTSAYQEVGGCRAPFKQGAEDYDLWLRLSEAGWALANLRELLAFYRTHAGQVSGTGVERFVIPTVAVQLSARARREGRKDPYGDFETFSYEQFVQAEPLRETVDHAVLNVAAGQATFVALIGQPEQARRLLDWATEITRATPVQRATHARLSLARAVTSWKTRRHGATIRYVVEGALADPQRTLPMLAKGVRATLWPGGRGLSSRGKV